MCVCIFKGVPMYFSCPLEQVQVTSSVKTMPRTMQFCRMLSKWRLWLSNGTADAHYASSLLHGCLSCLRNSRPTVFYVKRTWGKMKWMMRVVFFRILCCELQWFMFCFPASLCIVQEVWEQEVSKLGNPQLLVRALRFHLFHFTSWKFHSPMVLISELCCSSEEKQMLSSFQQQFFCKHPGQAWLWSVCWCSSQMLYSYCCCCVSDVKLI